LRRRGRPDGAWKPGIGGESKLPDAEHGMGRRAFLGGFATGAAWLATGPGTVSSRAGDTEGDSGVFPIQDVAGAVGAAGWLAQAQFTVSSLETGPIGYLLAWGGDEIGHSYRYDLSGQPVGLAVDRQTGLLNVTGRIHPGTHRFTVAVANRKDRNKVARFEAALLVKRGVVAGRADDRILHKRYTVDSGEYGQPQGQDYTRVLERIRTAILADEEAAGDGNLRATIQFRRGRTYNYTNNRWPTGIQYLTVEADFDPGSPRDRPRLCNVQPEFTFDSEIAILICGGESVFDRFGAELKQRSPRIRTTEVGANRVLLMNEANADAVVPGRWHLIGSYDQQVGGYPPNMRYFEYVKVTDVSEDTVLLDRRLRHRHREDFYESPTEPNSLGAARIVPLDPVGDPQSGTRFAVRHLFRDIEFVANPSTSNPSNRTVYVTGLRDATFDNCVIPHAVPSIVEHVRYVGGSVGDSEPDKLITTLILDAVRHGEAGGATGVDLYFVRNSTCAPMQISPRQLRVTDCVIDATHDRYLWYPVTWAYNGPILTAELERTVLKINPSNNDTRVMPSIRPLSLLLGRDAHWRGDRLVIPASSGAFLDWEVALFEGMIIYAGKLRWGIVRRLAGSGDGRAIWVGVQWIAGTKPGQGELQAYRGQSLTIGDGCKLEGRAAWRAPSGGFIRQRLPAAFGEDSRDFPPGYPASTYGF
jgi:hypothetical protein